MVKLATVASVSMLVFVSVILAVASGSGSTQEPAAQGTSLKIADTLHWRINYLCSQHGTVALYQGALAYRLLAGIPPSSYSGRWDVYPAEKVIDNKNNYAPQRATINDRLFSLQLAGQSEGEVVELIVHGERVAFAIRGVGQNWGFPRSPETTVRSLLKDCSDHSWNERMAREREAAGLKPTTPRPQDYGIHGRER